MNTFRTFQRGGSTVTLLGGLVAAVLFVYMLYSLAISGSKISAEDATERSINSRIHSAGTVKVSDGIEPGNRDGEQVYQKVCIQCHAPDATMANSPKLGNQAEWGPRIAQGYQTLIQNAVNGIRTMPARGGSPDLTDDELARAIAYMANQSGANFTPPPVEGADAAAEEAAAQ